MHSATADMPGVTVHDTPHHLKSSGDHIHYHQAMWPSEVHSSDCHSGDVDIIPGAARAELSCRSDDVSELTNTLSRSHGKVMESFHSTSWELAIRPKSITPYPSDASSSSYDFEFVDSESVATESMKRQAPHGDSKGIPSSVKVSNAKSLFGSLSISTGGQYHSPYAAAAPTAYSTGAIRKRREQFLLFVKILLKCLAENGNPIVTEGAKQIVLECTKGNRMGDPMFASLVDAASSRLRVLVGESTWRRAILLLRHYIGKRTMMGRTNASQP